MLTSMLDMDVSTPACTHTVYGTFEQFTERLNASLAINEIAELYGNDF